MKLNHYYYSFGGVAFAKQTVWQRKIKPLLKKHSPRIAKNNDNDT